MRQGKCIQSESEVIYLYKCYVTFIQSGSEVTYTSYLYISVILHLI